MFDTNTGQTTKIRQLIIDIKKYFQLQQNLLKVEAVEKLTILMGMFLLLILLMILGTGALFYILYALAYLLEPYVGGLVTSFGIIGFFYLLLLVLIVVLRKPLILNPLARFLYKLFLKDSDL